MDPMPHTLALRDIGKYFTIHERLFTARVPKELGSYCFHRCLSVHISGGGGVVPPSS